MKLLPSILGYAMAASTGIICGKNSSGGNIMLFETSCDVDNIVITVAPKCRTPYLSAIDWDVSFFDKDGEGFASPDNICQGAKNVPANADKTYTIPHPTADAIPETPSCNMGVTDTAKTKVYTMAFNFMINQTTKFGRVKFQCTYDTQIGAVGEATYEIGSEFTSEVEAVADKSIAAKDLKINIYGQSAGSAVWQVKAGSLNLSEKIKLEIEDAPTKNKLATHTIGIEKCWGSTADANPPAGTTPDEFTFFENKCPLAGLPWVTQTAGKLASVELNQFAFASQATASTPPAFYYHCEVNYCINGDTSCITALSGTCPSRRKRSSIMISGKIFRRDLSDGENTPLSEAAGPYNISSAGCEISSENGIDFCVEPEKKTSGADKAIISLIMGPIVWFLH